MSGRYPVVFLVDVDDTLLEAELTNTRGEVVIACPIRDRMNALDCVFHSDKPYRSSARVSIEPSTESQLSRRR
jgi:hypothetical protein